MRYKIFIAMMMMALIVSACGGRPTPVPAPTSPLAQPTEPPAPVQPAPAQSAPAQPPAAGPATLAGTRLDIDDLEWSTGLERHHGDTQL